MPALHCIFKNAKQCNWSIEKLLEKTKMALDGNYHPQNFSNLEIELAMAIYELGGSAALYALHKSPFAFPSCTTLLEHHKKFSLCITVGDIKISDILANIKTMFKEVQLKHKTVRITLSMDEIACDNQLCYLPATDEIAGLYEHASSQFPSLKIGNNLAVVCSIQEAVC